MRRRDRHALADLERLLLRFIAHHLHRDEAAHRVADEIDLGALRFVADAIDEGLEALRVRGERREPRIVEAVDGTEPLLRERATEAEEADAVLHVPVHEDDRHVRERLLSATREEAIHPAADEIEERKE